MRDYATPAAFRAAVEARLRDRARRLGMPAYIFRRQAALERLMVRLTRVAPNRWAVKGGFALETRLGDRARVSVDLDADHVQGGGTTRARDLVDLLLIRQHEHLDAPSLRDAIRQVFDRRATHGLPERLAPPPRELGLAYRREAERVRVPAGLDQAHQLLVDWLDSCAGPDSRSSQRRQQ